MTQDFDLQVSIRNGAIIVTLSGIQFYARYRKKDRAPWLVATGHSRRPQRSDQSVCVSRSSMVRGQ